LKPSARFGFDRFRDLARDPTLSESEKMDGRDGSRDGFEGAIWASILSHLPPLGERGADILDIGAGCGEIARRMIALAEANGHRVAMVDHEEMLAHLPASPSIARVTGRFPEAFAASAEAERSFDAILAYSVLQYVIVDANPFAFLDSALARLKPGGWLLLGDVPNFSKLRRFLASDAGIAHHHVYMKTDQEPDVPPFAILRDCVDDGLMIGLVMRARLAGFDAYLLPQAPNLPFANWREDLLVRRP
jgi:2-polyprenyl-3-methyl-5-hydroxy-6-metoxy-1,4-benzoquinol methylase